MEVLVNHLEALVAGIQELFRTLAPALRPWATAVSISVIAVAGVQNVIYGIQLLLATYALARRPAVTNADALTWLYGDVVLPVSLIVPAHNEDATIVEVVEALLALDYPLFEVIVVNDGSSDGTLERLCRAYDLQVSQRASAESLPHAPVRQLYAAPAHPRLVVVDKDNGGKADALNAGIVVARMPLFASLDSDSLLEGDSLTRIVQPFIEDPERTVAVGGTVRVVNDSEVEDGRISRVQLPRNLLARLQVMEYIRAFLIGRLGWSQLGVLTTVAGAFGVFRHSAVVEVGGFRRDTVGEDYELVMRMHRRFRESGRDYRVMFVPEPVCWTQVPETWRGLMAQRLRWQRGALETFAIHARMLLNPRYGRVGFLSMGHNLLVDVLGPVAEALGYVLVPFFWALGALDTAWMLAFLSMIFTYGVFISLASLALEEMELKRFPRVRHLVALAALAVFENFGYRQINNLWRIAGTWQFLRGKRGQWGKIQRRTFRAASR